MRAVRLAGAAEGRLDAPLRPREAAPVLQGAGPAVRSALSRCVDQSWRGLVGTPSQERDSESGEGLRLSPSQERGGNARNLGPKGSENMPSFWLFVVQVGPRSATVLSLLCALRGCRGRRLWQAVAPLPSTTRTWNLRILNTAH